MTAIEKKAKETYPVEGWEDKNMANISKLMQAAFCAGAQEQKRIDIKKIERKLLILYKYSEQYVKVKDSIISILQEDGTWEE